MCGGTINNDAESGGSGGLSPRVWRHPLRASPIDAAIGSISTCVEAPISYPLKILVKRVYLHVCGGTKKLADDRCEILGLSPRVWRHLPENAEK